MVLLSLRLTPVVTMTKDTSVRPVPPNTLSGRSNLSDLIGEVDGTPVVIKAVNPHTFVLKEEGSLIWILLFFHLGFLLYLL